MRSDDPCVLLSDFRSSLVTRHSPLPFSAFLGSDREKGRDLLLNLLALAFRTGRFPFIVFRQRQDHAKVLFAFAAVVFVLGHRCCPPNLLMMILTETPTSNKVSDAPRRGSAVLSCGKALSFPGASKDY